MFPTIIDNVQRDERNKLQHNYMPAYSYNDKPQAAATAMHQGNAVPKDIQQWRDVDAANKASREAGRAEWQRQVDARAPKITFMNDPDVSAADKVKFEQKEWWTDPNTKPSLDTVGKGDGAVSVDGKTYGYHTDGSGAVHKFDGSGKELPLRGSVSTINMANFNNPYNGAAERSAMINKAYAASNDPWEKQRMVQMMDQNRYEADIDNAGGDPDKVAQVVMSRGMANGDPNALKSYSQWQQNKAQQQFQQNRLEENKRYHDATIGRYDEDRELRKEELAAKKADIDERLKSHNLNERIAAKKENRAVNMEMAKLMSKEDDGLLLDLLNSYGLNGPELEAAGFDKEALMNDPKKMAMLLNEVKKAKQVEADTADTNLIFNNPWNTKKFNGNYLSDYVKTLSPKG